MKYLLVLSLACSFFTLFSQDSKTLNKWKAGIIHLRTMSTDTTGYAAFYVWQTAYKDSLEKLKNNRVIDLPEYLKKVSESNAQSPRTKVSRPLISGGTALFIKKGDRRYLVTAKHIVHDEIEASFRKKYEPGTPYDSSLLKRRISIIPRFDEVILDTAQYNIERGLALSFYERQISDQDSLQRRVDNLALATTANSLEKPVLFSGTRANTPCACYTFSAPNDDLAVFSLDNANAIGMGMFTSIGDYLESKGYRPISFKDISDELATEGTNVFVAGFPGFVSFVNDNVVPKKYRSISNLVAEPVFSFGKVAMNNPGFDRFWIDATVLPGNSGGPVIENNKLVGIVIAQALSGIMVGNAEHPTYASRSAFTLVVKSKVIKELILLQEERDNCQKDKGSK